MARLSPSTEDLLVVSRIHEDVKKYFINTWAKKWFVHGTSFQEYENIHNKKVFFESVKDEIDEQLNKKYGLVKASEMSISVDSIRRFILKSKSGFDDKVLEAFLTLYNPSISLSDYKYDLLDSTKNTFPSSSIKHARPYLKWAIPIIAIVVVVFIFRYLKKEETKSENLIYASVVPSVGFPKKIVIDSNLKGMKYRSAWVYVDNLRLEVTSETQELTMLQNFPKRAKVKLVLDNEVVEEKLLIIPSDGWSGMQNNITPLPKESFIKDGLMTVSNMPNDGKDYYYSFINIKDFGIDGNEFSMEADIINNAKIGGIWAYDISVDILGTKGDITFNLLAPSAGMYTVLKVGNSDFTASGSILLKNLGVVLDDWNKLKVSTNQNNFQIKLKNKVLVEDSYEGEIGDIVGLQFYVKGAGALKNVQLYPYENPDKAIKL